MSAGAYYEGKPTGVNDYRVVTDLGQGRSLIEFSDGRRKRIAPEICMFRIVATGALIPYKPDWISHPETDPAELRTRTRPSQRYTYEVRPERQSEFAALEATGFFRDPDPPEIIDNRRAPGA
jgi:hypothetical protein